MNANDSSVSRHAEGPIEATDPREDLLQRVVSSSTFEKSPKLRAFLLYVCRCAIESEPAAATEQQIGIHVFGRSPGYNPNEDNIVRSQARLLRLKLEHHFANDGKDEPVVIAIPKGRYLPTFEKRFEQPTALPERPASQSAMAVRRSYLLTAFISLTVVFGVVIVWLVGMSLRSGGTPSISSASGPALETRSDPSPLPSGSQVLPAPVAGEVRIVAGSTGAPYVDSQGRRWEPDQFYQGGVAKDGPRDFFPPVPDPNLFRKMREGASADSMAPPAQSAFRYEIPVPPGVYELRLHFADPVRRTGVEVQQDGQNLRHFNVNVNGHQILSGFDVIADAGSAPVDVRAFKDITPAKDGKVHLEFVPSPERPFVSAIELTPGTPGKMKPIRLSARNTDFVDSNGTRWSADNHYVGGRTSLYANPDAGPKVDALFAAERFGNFSYVIPVPPGSYTVKLYFLESFFSPLTAPSGICRGAGCRVFDVSCNGVELLRDFDIYQAAGGGLRPVIRTFQHLRPNGQGKLLLSFSPKVNYAEVRAIEVIDEAK